LIVAYNTITQNISSTNKGKLGNKTEFALVALFSHFSGFGDCARTNYLDLFAGRSLDGVVKHARSHGNLFCGEWNFADRHDCFLASLATEWEGRKLYALLVRPQ
jgi:hypothetical protein